MKKNTSKLLLILLFVGVNTYSQTTWDGSESTNWDTAANWSTNSAPDFGYSGIITIPNVTNDPIINGTNIYITANLEIAADAVLTLNNGAIIHQIGGIISNSGSVILNSGSQIKTDGTASGNYTYNRNLATTNWYLVTSPFIGQDVDDFVTAEGLETSGSNIALATYTTNGNTWAYYQSTDSGTGAFPSGTGYSIKLVSSGDVTFTGTFQASDVSKTLTTTGQGYQLLGNPFASHIKSGEMLNASSILETKTLWVWNQSTSAYQSKNVGSAFKLAPTQGFIIQSDGTAGSLSIGESLQTTTTDTFQKQQINEIFRIDLNLTDGTTIREAFLEYREGSTTGFDDGYDSPIFAGVSNPFTIYTHAVANGGGRDLEIQSLPDDNYENMIVPLGINAVSGSEITITPNITNIPTGIKIYIEDKEDESFTLLENSSSFRTTISSDMKGIGRFYIHTTSGVLGTGDILLNNNLSVYTSTRTNLRVVGVQKGIANIQLFDILGKQVLNTSFKGSNINDIVLPFLNNGIYIVNLKTDLGILNKKISIK